MKGEISGFRRRVAIRSVLQAAWVCALAVGVAPAVAGEPASLKRAIAWQLSLERVGLSPGIIDGVIGPKTELATREFQRVRGLPITGRLDKATVDALGVDRYEPLDRYTIRKSDAAAVGPVPRGWRAKSRLKRLKYESLAARIAERFHCTRGLLGRLNPSKSLSRLKPGEVLVVPAAVAVAKPSAPKAARIEVDLRGKLIRAFDAKKRLVGLFHCSIAREKRQLPRGPARVAVVARDPVYIFDPAMWKEIKGINRKLTIPPGPRNPVGLCWIGLSLKGYGIHGTPKPELIGKTGSHGCIRLTNWDALRLGRMVRPGTPVRFTNAPLALAKRGR